MARTAKAPQPKRRDRGEGAIFSQVRNGKERWLSAVSQMIDGKRVRKYFTGATKGEVRIKRNDYLAARGTKPATVSSKESADIAGQTVADFAAIFLANRKRYAKAATHESYEKTWRVHLEPKLGRIPLVQLTAAQIERAYDGIASPSMRKRAHTTLRALLNNALKKGAITATPLATIDAPTYRAEKFKPLTEAQVGKLLKISKDPAALRRALKDDRLVKKVTRLAAMIQLAVDSGARQGELFALAWEDVDLSKGIIYIRQGASETRDGIRVGDLKTDGSARNVTISPQTVAALRERKRIAAKEGLADCQTVFPSEGGWTLRKANFLRDFWTPVRAAAGLPTLRFHDLRHTCATMLFKQGVHPKVVCERLGHASVAFTLQVYSSWIPSMQATATAALSSLFEKINRAA